MRSRDPWRGYFERQIHFLLARAYRKAGETAKAESSREVQSIRREPPPMKPLLFFLSALIAPQHRASVTRHAAPAIPDYGPLNEEPDGAKQRRGEGSGAPEISDTPQAPATDEMSAAASVRFEGRTMQLLCNIGSERTGQSFLWSDDGFLFQAPVTWYSQKHLWDVSPGYQHDRSTRWNRPSNRTASTVTPVFEPDRFTVLKIDTPIPPSFRAGWPCERCHGPALRPRC